MPPEDKGHGVSGLIQIRPGAATVRIGRASPCPQYRVSFDGPLCEHDWFNVTRGEDRFSPFLMMPLDSSICRMYAVLWDCGTSQSYRGRYLSHRLA